MPKGAPLQHTYNGIVANGINFFSGSVTPTPPPKPKIAGVWPDRFDANMTIAGGSIAKKQRNCNKRLCSFEIRLPKTTTIVGVF